MQFFLDKRIDIEIKYKSRKTSLHCIAFREYKTIIQLLLDKEADVEVRDKNE